MVTKREINEIVDLVVEAKHLTDMPKECQKLRDLWLICVQGHNSKEAKENPDIRDWYIDGKRAVDIALDSCIYVDKKDEIAWNKAIHAIQKCIVDVRKLAIKLNDKKMLKRVIELRDMAKKIPYKQGRPLA